MLGALHSRRAAVRGGAAGIAAVAIGVTATQHGRAQDATPMATPTAADVSLLFVQTARSGSIAASTAPGESTLTLADVGSSVIYFSDRPNRTVGTIATADFIEQFAAAATDDPPNAALVAKVGDAEAIFIFELFTPAYDAAENGVRYRIRELGQTDIDMDFHETPVMSIEVAVELGECHLFIDDLVMGCSPWDPRC
jgi:hypothetical protein